MDVRTVLAITAALAAAGWLSVVCVTLVGRLAWERRQRRGRIRGRRGSRGADRLVRHASRHRGEAGKWRRIAALRALAREDHPRTRALLRRALSDADAGVAGAAVRALGDRRDDWAIDALLEALRDGRGSRSRIGAQLEHRVPEVASRLVAMLDEPDPSVRFWAASLLAEAPGVGTAELLTCTRDHDANVRAAAVEALGERGEREALPAVRARLLDETWFVRVHACRALGQLGDAGEAPRVARALGDPWWWVRAAAKDALHSYGIAAAGAVIPYLEDDDKFVRNGAAEVLQNLQLVDMLALSGSEQRLLQRILAAGGPDMREAALQRAREHDAQPVEREVRAG